METSVDTQNYSWKLENRPGYKILVLKHQSVGMGMFDKNWIKTLPSFQRQILLTSRTLLPNLTQLQTDLFDLIVMVMF